ncbi:trypsin-like cysteine/serine peptidase domain-containing protein [Aspergillus caelatus]|uniref:Trypsin-like cysteine/serine peptidase domain-containing protein n=1 Tax=Aspergillus caelatus TaxID=61420 RepID=A0A5N6ZUP6_9EURO|nr:trypsin-like cysteine/serine peptidase domain-containing protein [Aspergillus caelatus]KAE8361344.1 trypsin-like cysteine/serine peptidase domain-containing protein [Aspergillus caelatus]
MKSVKALGNLPYCILLIAQSVSALVGGTDASANDAPFTVAVISSGWFGDSYICAGSLISPKTVLTTAGCADGSSASSLKVRVGSLDHATGGKLNQVTKIIKHPNYNTNTRDSDFAVLHLTYPVMDIKPVAIPEQTTLTGAPVSLYGWGLTGKLLNQKPRKLQRLDTTFISANDCNPIWSDVNPVTPTMNCDAAPEKHQGSCNHDQGGPVVSDSGELVGLMGYYDYCEPHSNGRPDVNNDPLSASDWIALNTI